jgi:hypothetical protein
MGQGLIFPQREENPMKRYTINVNNMKNTISIELLGFVSLADVFSQGIKAFSYKKRKDGSLSSVIFKVSDENIVEIYCKMTDVYDWVEIGSLIVENKKDVNDNIWIYMNESWQENLKFFALCLDNENFYSESGLVIKNKNSEEITILPSSSPYSITIKSNFFNDGSDPEYDIKNYRRLAL